MYSSVPSFSGGMNSLPKRLHGTIAEAISRATGAAFGLLAGLVLTPTIRVEDLPRSVPGDATPVGAPVR